jgi:hypothetical protein
MNDKEAFWSDRGTIRGWKDVRRFEDEFFPRPDGRGMHLPPHKIAPKWIFRAAKPSQHLETCLEERFRLHAVKDKDKIRRERGRIRAFQRQAPLYLESAPDKDDILEWLAIMRHRGAPTRLLDWTYSFYIAVYFALNENREGIVWALDVSSMNKPEPIVTRICKEENGFRKFSKALLHYCPTMGVKPSPSGENFSYIACVECYQTSGYT